MFEIRHCHYCSVDAHAKISVLFLIMKWICVVWARGSIGGSCVYTWTGHWTALISCLVSSLGVDPLTVLFSHVVESWKTHWMAPTQPKPKPKRNLWCSGMFWTFVLDLDTEWKKLKKNFHLVGALLRKRWTKMFFLKCFSWKWKKIA